MTNFQTGVCCHGEIAGHKHKEMAVRRAVTTELRIKHALPDEQNL